MVRRWALRPDPDMGIVPREAIVSQFMEAEAILDKIGGVLSVVYDRRRTDLEGEAVTVGVVFEFRERTDAKPRPEVETHEVPTAPAPAPTPEPEPEPAPEPEPREDEDATEPVVAPAAVGAARPAVLPFASGGSPTPTARTGGQDEPDAGGVVLGPDGEPEEDLTSIPAGMR